MCVAVIIGAYVSYHFFTTVNENEINGLAKQAADFFEYKNLYVLKTERRGTYLAVLCKDKKGNVCMCEFEKDSLFKNRWSAAGGKSYIEQGKIDSFNYGSPQREAVIICCGSDIPAEAAYYKFENSGTTYICPVENGSVLDVFIIQDADDIGGFPVLLDKNGKEIE